MMIVMLNDGDGVMMVMLSDDGDCDSDRGQALVCS